MDWKKPMGTILDLYGNRLDIPNEILAQVSLTRVIGIGKVILPLVSIIPAINYTGVQ
jgi:hypothetical protein